MSKSVKEYVILCLPYCLYLFHINRRKEVSILVLGFYCILGMQWTFLCEWLTWDPRVCISCCWKLILCFFVFSVLLLYHQFGSSYRQHTYYQSLIIHINFSLVFFLVLTFLINMFLKLKMLEWYSVLQFTRVAFLQINACTQCPQTFVLIDDQHSRRIL